MLENLSFMKKWEKRKAERKEKKQERKINRCRNLIEEYKAYYEFDYWRNNTFDSPRIRRPMGANDIVLISEITIDYFTIIYTENGYKVPSYKKLRNNPENYKAIVLKIEKDDPLFDKIKKDLEEDKNGIKKAVFNERMSSMEELKNDLEDIQYKIRQTNERLQKKKEIFKDLHPANGKNIGFVHAPFVEEDELIELEKKKAKIEKSMNEVSDSLKNFNFNSNIFIENEKI